jgi:hypothetical protein
MASWLNQRNAAMGGILAMVLLVVGNFIAGNPPKFNASSASIADFYSSHHRTLLIAAVLTGLAVPLYIWFVAYLAMAIDGALGTAIALGGILLAACAATGDTLNVSLAHGVRLADGASVYRLTYQLEVLAYSRLFWAGLAVAIPLAVAVGRGALRPWVGYVAWAQAVLYLLGGLSLKSSGFFSPTGGMAIIAYLAFFVGTAVIAFGLWQSSPAEARAQHAAATPV